VEDLTLAEEEGRKQVLIMADFLRTRVPGFEKASISCVGAQIGVRESRRIVGLYTLTMSSPGAATRSTSTTRREQA
jgi:hypothetical protein